MSYFEVNPVDRRCVRLCRRTTKAMYENNEKGCSHDRRPLIARPSEPNAEGEADATGSQRMGEEGCTNGICVSTYARQCRPDELSGAVHMLLYCFPCLFFIYSYTRSFHLHYGLASISLRKPSTRGGKNDYPAVLTQNLPRGMSSRPAGKHAHEQALSLLGTMCDLRLFIPSIAIACSMYFA